MESKIATYSAEKTRIQLLKITTERELQLGGGKIGAPLVDPKINYQIRNNRKIIYKTSYESIARKKFASIVNTEILQQKFSF